MGENKDGVYITDVEKLNKEISYYKTALEGLRKELYRMDMSNMFRRLDYLFRIVEHRAAFSDEFVVGCINEIESCMNSKGSDNGE